MVYICTKYTDMRQRTDVTYLQYIFLLVFVVAQSFIKMLSVFFLENVFRIKALPHNRRDTGSIHTYF
jgi:hypothetical protein